MKREDSHDKAVWDVQNWLNNNYKGKEGYIPFEEDEIDGITGMGTFSRLIRALQIELKTTYGKSITVDGDFGKKTLEALPATIGKSGKSNINYIIQGSLLCKGYNAGSLDGIFGDNTADAVSKFQSDAGIKADGIIRPFILQGIMNTDGYAFVGEINSEEYYKHLVQLDMNGRYGSSIGLIAPSGLWERKSHMNLIKCCQIEWGTTPDGKWGTNTMQKAPTLSKKKTGYTNSKRLLKWALTVNGYFPGKLDGSFDEDTYSKVYEFQDFMCLGADGVVGKNTWASLLSSAGNKDREVTACDTATRLSREAANRLVSKGITDVGRYLTNASGVNVLDKRMTAEELAIIKDAGLKVFPIFQKTSRQATYFTREQGRKDAIEAKKAAKNFGFPRKTVLYFAVDYDVKMEDIGLYIVPYFRGLNDAMGSIFRIGVYGPRAVCNELYEHGLAYRSFVSDMSTAYTGNIGQKMPENWAYEQIKEESNKTVYGVSVDKCVSSPRATAISPKDFVEYKKEDNVEKDNRSWLEEIRIIYNVALGKRYNIVELANIEALRYLRGRNYGGVAWNHVAGERDAEVISLIEEYGVDIVPEEFTIYDKESGIEMGFAHFAATLNGYLYDCALSYEEKIDQYFGWFGDLVQMGAILEDTEKHGNNYLTERDLKELIGARKPLSKDYHFFSANGETLSSAGFSFDDLIADVDAFNMSALYSFKDKPLYEIFEDYYYESQLVNKRFAIFKQELLKLFGFNRIGDCVQDLFGTHSFAECLASMGFDAKFGSISPKHYMLFSESFEGKIEQLI